jgi:hypothetical protein
MVDAAVFTPSPAGSPWILRYPRSGFSPRQPEGQGLDVPAGRRPAGLAAHGPRRLAAADDVAVLAQDGIGVTSSPSPWRQPVKVAGSRRKIEDGFAAGKELAALDQHQVRSWTS